MEKHFHQELEMLKTELLNMAGLVQQMLDSSVAALINLDSSKIEFTNTTEHTINRIEMEIDQNVSKLIALHQPVGQDLRLLNIISKITNDLERIADEAVNICERVKHLIENPLLEKGFLLPQMAELSKEMLKKSVDALLKNDISVADEIFSKEDVLDGLNRKLIKDVIEQIKRKPEITELALDVISISHRFERVGDMSVNIVEDVIYFITGKDVRHPYDRQDRSNQ